MSRDVSICAETTLVGSALDQMESEQRRRLPVKSARGEIVGVISPADAARGEDDMVKVIRVFNQVFARRAVKLDESTDERPIFGADRRTTLRPLWVAAGRSSVDGSRVARGNSTFRRWSGAVFCPAC